MIQERLQTVFRILFSDADLELTDDLTAADVDGWDSVAHINLMFAVESEFDIIFPGNEFAKLTDVGELRRMIEAKLESA